MNSADPQSSAVPARGRYDVLIAGAGPVGLTLAALLRSSSRSVLLVERRLHPYLGARAMHLDRTSVELVEAAGVQWQPGLDLDDLAGVSFDARPHGEVRIELGALCPDELAPFAFHQPSLERKLRSLLIGSTVEQRVGCNIVSLRPEGNVTRVGLRHGRGAAEVCARLVVGCDGAQSTVRRLARISSRAWGGEAEWHAVDHMLASRPSDRLVRHHLGARPVTVVPGCGRHVRVEHLLRAAHGGRRWPAPSERTLADLLGSAVQETMAERCYRFETRLALRPTRASGTAAVILAGDAAHTVAPFLGQGLGLGLRDAALLAALLRSEHTSPDELARAYERVRRGDVLAVATESRLAQLLVERGGDRRLVLRLLGAISALAQRRPALMHHAALAHRGASLR